MSERKQRLNQKFLDLLKEVGSEKQSSSRFRRLQTRLLKDTIQGDLLYHGSKRGLGDILAQRKLDPNAAGWHPLVQTTGVTDMSPNMPWGGYWSTAASDADKRVPNTAGGVVMRRQDVSRHAPVVPVQFALADHVQVPGVVPLERGKVPYMALGDKPSGQLRQQARQLGSRIIPPGLLRKLEDASLPMMLNTTGTPEDARLAAIKVISGG
jgi:hypothetical protein